MKTPRSQMLALLLTFSAITPCLAQSSSSRAGSVWVPPPVGSLLGGGYTDTGKKQVSPGAPTTNAFNAEPAPLKNALASLDAKSDMIINGKSAMVSAVSGQTSVSTTTLKGQRAKTGLSFTELLVANSIAEGSKTSFDSVVAMREKSRAWAEVANRLHVSVNSLTARARAADQAMASVNRANQRTHEQTKDDSGLRNYGRGNIGKPPGG